MRSSDNKIENKQLLDVTFQKKDVCIYFKSYTYAVEPSSHKHNKVKFVDILH